MPRACRRTCENMREAWLMICQGLYTCRRLFQLHPPQQSRKLQRRHLLRSAWVRKINQKTSERKRRKDPKRTQNIYDKSLMYMDPDGMSVTTESLIFVSTLSIIEWMSNIEKYQSACATNLMRKTNSREVKDCTTNFFWSKHVFLLLFLSGSSIRWFDREEMERTWM